MRGLVSDDARTVLEEIPADADEQFGEHRFLVREVAVDGGAADADRAAQVFETHPREPTLGDEARSGIEDLEGHWPFLREEGGVVLLTAPTSPRRSARHH